ncbi:MAG: hypothetical protein AAF797_06445 [Planctomycetota bacterium]
MKLAISRRVDDVEDRRAGIVCSAVLAINIAIHKPLRRIKSNDLTGHGDRTAGRDGSAQKPS